MKSFDPSEKATSQPAATDGPSRRAVLKMLSVLGAGSVVSQYAGEGYTEQSPSDNKAQVIETPPATEVTDTPQIRLVFVSLLREGESPHYSADIIKSHTEGVARCLGRSSLRAVALSLEFSELPLEPEGVSESNELVYSEEQFKQIVADHKQNDHDIVVVMPNGQTSLWQSAQGLAHVDLGGISMQEGNLGAIAHELGHMVWNKDELDRKIGGLGHQSVLGTRLTISEGEVVQYYALGTFQQLCANGQLAFSTLSDGGINPYASDESIMGSRAISMSPHDSLVDTVGHLPEDQGPDNGGREPNYSPQKLPSLAFSAVEIPRFHPDIPLLREIVYDKKIYLQYSTDPDGVFGVALALPDDHVLRQYIPDANELFIGLSNKADGLELPNSSDYADTEVDYNVRLFVNRTDSNETVYLDIGTLNNVTEDHRVVICADEQMDFVLTAGREDDGREYVVFSRFSEPDSREKLNQARDMVAERNQVMLS